MAIAQDKLPNLMANRRIFDLFGVESVDDHIIMWEQMDNYTGLQQVRGLDGEPARVIKKGIKRYVMEPGTYGEFVNIDERELTTRRKIGQFGTGIDISDLVVSAQDQLLGRRLDRIENIGWTLLATGTFSVPGPNGAILHTDSYTTQSFTAAVPWATVSTATPLGDFRAVQLLHRGHSVQFDSSSLAYMNRVTWNRLISNSNPADLYGRRTAGLGIINNVGAFNQLLAGDDLPQIAIYDDGYLNDAGTFVPFLPNGTVILAGKRPAGQKVAAFKYTRNANNPDMAPGAYMKVIDLGEVKVPRSIQVHDGGNYGPAIYYPSAIVVLSV